MKILFDSYSNVCAGLSERVDGSMTWWNTKPIDPLVKERRDHFFEKQGIEPTRVVSGGLIHGNHTVVVGEQEAGEYLLDTDALVTQTPNVFLTITVADCLPVFFYDSVTLSVGIAHAGWKGMIKGVLESVVCTFQEAFDSHPSDIQVVIGPYIQSCHFEVQQDVAAEFNVRCVERRDHNLFVNLGTEAKQRLNKVGVQNISIDSMCTFDIPSRFFSARRDKMSPIQGMVAFIGLKF
jgi:hypothetical protein